MTDRPDATPPEHTPLSAEEPRRYRADRTPEARDVHDSLDPSVEPVAHPGAPEAQPAPSGRWVPIAVIAAIALLIAGALLWNRSRQEPEPASTATATGTATATSSATPSATATETAEPTETPSPTEESPDGADATATATASASEGAATSPFGPNGEGSALDNPLASGAAVPLPAADGTATVRLGRPEVGGTDRLPADQAARFEGGQVVLLPVDVSYQGSGTYDAWGSLDASFLVPQSDRMIEQVEVELPDALSSVAPLRDGESGSGYLVYAFPPDVAPEGVWMLEPSGADPVFVDLR